MSVKKFFSISIFLLFSIAILGQENLEQAQFDQWSYGMGVGQNYGGLGANVLFYPQKNIGLFLGGGYAFVGFGHNLGIKARLVTKNQKNSLYPYLLAMHGYHAAIKIEGAPNYNKMFYGLSLGMGFDFSFRNYSNRKGFWSLAIIFPFRGDGVDKYMTRLKTYGVEFSNQLSPVTFSFGHSFIIN